ncbi:MAG: hypothetical protein KJP00_12625 [Bacteroidia bacterium]|nr:hypothetical protein [Bacteroidia bacterium]
MNFKLIPIILALLLGCSHTLIGQDLKRKKKSSDGYFEDYYVLKSDKKIKQGQYVRFDEDDLGNRSVSQMGFYERDQPADLWSYFHANGSSLKEEGSYREGKRNGLWKTFFKSDRLRSADSNELNQAIHVDETGTIQILRNNLPIASEGVYLNGEKVGAWNYYSKKGQLIDKYDHSNNKLVSDNRNDQNTPILPYLGGEDHLDYLLHEFFDNLRGTKKSKTGKVEYAIDFSSNQPNFNLIAIKGNSNIKEILREFVTNIPDYWLPSIDNNNYSKLIFTILENDEIFYPEIIFKKY